MDGSIGVGQQGYVDTVCERFNSYLTDKCGKPPSLFLFVHNTAHRYHIRGSVEQVEREAREIILRRTTEPTRIILETTLTIDTGRETTGD
jgi:hypothetical protein